MKQANFHINNINKHLKYANSKNFANFVCLENNGVVITTNQTAFAQNISIINNCIREIENINSKYIDTPWLPMSKSYLKILDLPYVMNSTNLSITPDIVVSVLKEIHIFNNVALTSKPYIIKASNNLAVIWINIWDLQNSSKTKFIINCWFNVEHFIVTVCSTNINSGILYCKNCWKWEHSTFVSRSLTVDFVYFHFLSFILFSFTF